jgi:signal transduction histidine kinase/DNA-binding response OmpR family regulator
MDAFKKGIHVLVIDDEIEARERIVLELSQQGYEVSSAPGGKSALEIQSKRRIHVVLSDISMPQMDGMEVLKRMKGNDPELEVILVTGYANVESAVRAMKEGAFDYVPKPLSMTDITVRIEKAIEKMILKKTLELYETSQSVFAAAQLTELYKLIMDLLHKFLKSDECSLVLKEEDGDLAIFAERNVQETKLVLSHLAYAEKCLEMSKNSGLPVLIVDDKRTEPVWSQIAAEHTVFSAIICPIISNGTLLGTIQLIRKQNRENFTAIDLSRAKAFSVQAAAAIENGRRFEALRQGAGAIREVFPNSNLSSISADKLESIGRLVSGMAHEINNPLTAVIGYAQLLMDTGGQDLQKHLKIIKDQAQRCGKIIQDLMVFARRRKPAMEQIDLTAVVSESIESAAPETQPRKINLHFDSPKTVILVQGEAAQLRRVFIQLITNAAQALESRKTDRRIQVRLKSSGGTAEVSIEDNGPGIEPQNLSLVFDPFFTTKEVGKGTGLGLSLCHGLISQHGGRVIAESVLGQRAIFTVRLPIAVETAPPKPPADICVKSPVRKGQILIVEDELMISEFMKRILMDQGFNVSTAEDGETACQKMRDDSFDLILCDYRIPRKNGLQILETAKKDLPEIEKKFVFVTASLGFADRQDELKLQGSGVSVLTKPFTAAELLKIVQDRLPVSSSRL